HRSEVERTIAVRSLREESHAKNLRCQAATRRYLGHHGLAGSNGTPDCGGHGYGVRMAQVPSTQIQPATRHSLRLFAFHRRRSIHCFSCPKGRTSPNYRATKITTMRAQSPDVSYSSPVSCHVQS